MPSSTTETESVALPWGSEGATSWNTEPGAVSVKPRPLAMLTPPNEKEPFVVSTFGPSGVSVRVAIPVTRPLHSR